MNTPSNTSKLLEVTQRAINETLQLVERLEANIAMLRQTGSPLEILHAECGLHERACSALWNLRRVHGLLSEEPSAAMPISKTQK